MLRANAIVALVVQLLLVIAVKESTCLCNRWNNRAENANIRILSNMINGNALRLLTGVTVLLASPMISMQQRAYQSCGYNTHIAAGAPLRVGGKTIPGQFPWVVGIFTLKSRTNWAVFKCGGTLVSPRHVVTAGQCIEENGSLLNKCYLRISIGYQRLSDWNRPGVTDATVESYILHPEYQIGVRNSHADIAILVLWAQVEFTPTVQPICLWSGNTDLNEIIGHFGFVVGWGKYESCSPNNEEPVIAIQPIVAKNQCMYRGRVFLQPNHSRTFCAGAHDGSIPCNADIGSGLYMMNHRTGQFFLRGVLSTSLVEFCSSNCHWSHYAIYSDAAKDLAFPPDELEPWEEP